MRGAHITPPGGYVCMKQITPPGDYVCAGIALSAEKLVVARVLRPVRGTLRLSLEKKKKRNKDRGWEGII